MKTVSAITLEPSTEFTAILANLSRHYQVELAGIEQAMGNQLNSRNEIAIFLLKLNGVSNQQYQQQIHNYLVHNQPQRIFCIISHVSPSSQLQSKLSSFLSIFHDIIFWPCAREELITRINRFDTTLPRREVIDRQLMQRFAHLNLIGESQNFVQALSLIKKVSNCDAPVLLEGETGTGKENAARAIHYLGERANNSFVPINCGALPDELLESELFGHCRGAFTDAKEKKEGLVAIADGGTLFLDEIDSLSTKGQSVLLRFLQTGEYRPLGGKTTSRANVRVIAASNANIQAKVDAEEFREDLMFRLKVLHIQLPALRDRAGDVEVLARNFIGKFAHIYNKSNKILSAAALRWLQRQDWPGNVRELENTLLRHFLLAEDNIIEIGNDEFGKGNGGWVSHNIETPACDSFQSAKAAAIRQFEKSYLNRILSQTSGNVSEAARISGKERRALGKMIQKYQIDKEAFHAPA